MCSSGKREYQNPKAARAALTGIRFQRDHNRKRKRREQSIYFCKLCQHFHLTSEPVDDDSDRFQ